MDSTSLVAFAVIGGIIVLIWLVQVGVERLPEVWPAWRCRRILRNIAANACPRCGYDLRANTYRCPECGHFIESTPERVDALLHVSDEDQPVAAEGAIGDVDEDVDEAGRREEQR